MRQYDDDNMVNNGKSIVCFLIRSSETVSHINNNNIQESLHLRREVYVEERSMQWADTADATDCRPSQESFQYLKVPCCRELDFHFACISVQQVLVLYKYCDSKPCPQKHAHTLYSPFIQKMFL